MLQQIFKVGAMLVVASLLFGGFVPAQAAPPSQLFQTTTTKTSSPPGARRLVAYKQITVREKDGDIDTGLDIRQNDYIVINAWGQIWAGVWATGKNGPGGWRNIADGNEWPLEGAHPYSLLMKVGDEIKEVGTLLKHTHTESPGRLYLLINDDVHGNGSGAFTARVQVWR